MGILLDLQQASDAIASAPTEAQFQHWLDDALLSQISKYREDLALDEWEITIRLVDDEEIQQLNKDYREKDKPTNVLSFPFESPPGVEIPLLGDLIISVPYVNAEAEEQGKSTEAHWAHMVLHGCLHLLGYDHITTEDAEEMEALEIKILAEWGFNNPYKAV